MAVEDKHMDVLHSIETAIINVYRDNEELKDANAMRAIKALIALYRSKVTKREAPATSDLNEDELKMYNNVLSFLKMRGNIGGSEHQEAPAKRRFSRAFKTQTPDEVYLTCLRRIEKSIKLWTRRNGIRGYLNFVKNYV